MTSTGHQIGGIRLSVKFATRLNKKDKTLPPSEISKSPLVNVSVVESDKGKTFDLKIVAFIPAMLSYVDTKPDSTIEMPLNNNGNSIFLQYNGIFRLQTPIQTNQEDKALLCREFELLYEASDMNTGYDVYMFVVNYELVFDNMQKAEAVIIRDRNIDPETSRGTVTTSSPI